ncbi:MAG: cell division/cell wall cluster transcriptional repressor MraZ, partial [Candidatus Limnocylindrales bacterium]
DGGAFVSRWIDGCLAIHTRAGWAVLSDKLASLPITDGPSRLFARSVFAGATEVELDKQGRLLLPQYLRDDIALGTEAVVLGARDHAEIWAPAVWAGYRRAMDDPATFAQAIQGLGI